MSVGEQWANKREAMGKSLEDVSSALHISQRYLRSIEEGSFEGWPERVFSSGFIRAYAKFLSEDPEPVLSEYHRYLEQKATSQPPAAPVRPMWVERERRRGTRRTSYAAAAAFVLLIGVVLAWVSWRMAPQSLPPAAGIPATPGSFPEPAAGRHAGSDNAAPAGGIETTDDAAPAEEADRANASAPPGAAAGVAPAPAAGNAPAGRAPGPPGGDNAARTAAVPASPRSPAPAGGSGVAKGPYRLSIAATELTWMMYGVDDADPVDVTLYPGDRMELQAKERLVIRLGNAGGVTGTLNGQELPPFGNKGQVKEIRLGE